MTKKWDKIYEGDDLAEALHKASKGSGIAEPELDYTIVEQGRRGLFGIGAKNVRIKVKPPLDAGQTDAGASTLQGSPEAKRPDSGRKRPGSSRRRRGSGRNQPDAAGKGKESGKAPDDDQGNRQGSGDKLVGSGDQRQSQGGRRRGQRGRGQGPGLAQGQGDNRKSQGGKRRGAGGRRPRSGDKRPGSGNPRTGPDNRRPRKPRPLMEASPEDLTKVEETVRRMLELMDLELELRIEVEPTGLFIGLDGADEKMLASDSGELLASIQFLLNRMSRRGWPSVARISLAHDERDHARDEELIELVREVAQQVESTGDAKRLHAMNAYERRLVHVTIRQTEGLGSRSEGNGSMKRVKIFKEEAGEQ